MKKLMIAAAIVCATACAHAAAGDWAIYTTGDFADPTTGEAIGGTMYFFNESYSQDTLLAALRDSGDIATLAAANGWAQSFTIASDGTLDTSITGGPASDQSLYEVVKVGNAFYIDEVVEYMHDGNVGGEIGLDLSYAGDSSIDFRIDKTATYEINGYGWYAIPEPTSGLLLLIGVAGLALRRRRA